MASRRDSRRFGRCSPLGDLVYYVLAADYPQDSERGVSGLFERRIAINPDDVARVARLDEDVPCSFAGDFGWEQFGCVRGDLDYRLPGTAHLHNHIEPLMRVSR